MMTEQSANTGGPDQPVKLTRSQLLIQQVLWLGLHVLLPLAVLGVAVWIGWQMLQTPPQPQRQPPVKRAPLVEVEVASSADEPVSVYAAGVVLPAQRVELKPQVGGKVESVADGLEPGARFKAGQELFKIEEQDYELARLQLESQVNATKARVTAAEQSEVSAERDLAIELANAAVARREFELFGGELTEEERSLVLREPQVAAARAAIESAKAQIKTAQADQARAEADLAVAVLNKQRTSVVAPFDLVVVERLVDDGDTVTTQTPMAVLVGTDRYWVELAVPERELKWIRLPDAGAASQGSTVHFRNDAAWGIGAERIGKVIRVVPTVDEAGRMARVLCAIEDPLSLGQREQGSGNIEPNVLVGSYLSAKIEGIHTPQAVVVPRDWVREGDQIWVLTNDSKLSIRQIETVYRGPDHLLVSSGIKPGERVVTTDLATPVDGMQLRLAPRPSPVTDDDPQEPAREAARPGQPPATTN